jgi:hypothetical protein
MEVVGERGFFPHRVKVRAPVGDKEKVSRTVAENLIGHVALA